MTHREFNRLFVYGTLMPGQSRWPILSPHIDGEPVPASVTGSLYNTGLGYPALFPGSNPVPGALVHLKSDSITETLGVLDEVEGVTQGLFRRVRVKCDGTPAWAYLGSDPTLSRLRIASWT